MKSIFTKLSTLLFAGAVALVGCSDFSADLREVNDKLDNLSNEAARKTEVEALKTNVENLLAQLENQYATKKEVAEVSATVTALSTAIETAKAELVAALDGKADKAAVETSIGQLSGALEELILPASLTDADDNSGVPVKLHVRMIERHVAKEDGW